MNRILFLIASLPLLLPIKALADTPTMGWSSWNTYRVNISDSLIKSQADALISTGLADHGYKYINIDDGFFGGRSADGKLLFHPARFPDGLRPVVDHIHALGLKAGIYSDAGSNTCGNFWDKDSIARGVGLYGHDTEDCRLFFSELGFDFIKIDFCGGDPKQNHDSLALDERTRYTRIAEAIKSTGRDDVRMNICRWDFPGPWGADIAASWRISHDISPAWWSVRDIIRQNLYLSAYCRNGRFNDMDMLEVGRGMPPDEDRTHFGMWCMMSSPLLIGCDLTTISPTTLSLLTTPSLIAINQDSLALQAYPVQIENGCIVVAKDFGTRHSTRRAVAAYNPTDSEAGLTLRFSSLDLDGEVKLTDAFGQLPIVTAKDSLPLTLPPHATAIYIADAQRRLDRTLYEAETALIGTYQELVNPLAAGTGFYKEDASCSGGAYAANLGHSPENYLCWEDVYVTEGGSYTLTLASVSDTESSADIYVNGAMISTLTFGGKGERNLEITLPAGSSSIKLVNPSDAMPDIDYMLIRKSPI